MGIIWKWIYVIFQCISYIWNIVKSLNYSNINILFRNFSKLLIFKVLTFFHQYLQFTYFSKSKTTLLIGEDTDLLVLLLHHSSDCVGLFMTSTPKANASTPPKVWNITEVQNVLKPSLCKILPIIHAISGCDTTSRIDGIGKGTALKKVKYINNSLKFDWDTKFYIENC